MAGNLPRPQARTRRSIDAPRRPGVPTRVTTSVRGNSRRNKSGTIYIFVLLAIGLGLGVGAYWLDWGVTAFTGAAFFLFMFVLGLRSLARGGAWQADCPQCGARLSSAEHAGNRFDAKLLRCEACKTYVFGRNSLDVVGPGFVHDEPVFAARLPADPIWPAGCAACGGTVARQVEVSTSPSAGAVVIGVELQPTASVRVPACANHRRPVNLVMEADGPVVEFPAFDIYREFLRLNDMPKAGPIESRAQLPDTPRGRFAASCDCRCKVHGTVLHIGPGYRWRGDALPSHEFEQQQMANPFCLDVGESFTPRPAHEPTTLIWCPDCVAAVRS